MGNLIQNDIVLLYANKYNMVDEQTGETSKGTSINYYFNQFKPTINQDGSKGLRPAKSTSDYELMNKVTAAPAMYRATFEMTIGSNMKPVLKIVDLEYLDEIQLITAN